MPALRPRPAASRPSSLRSCPAPVAVAEHDAPVAEIWAMVPGGRGGGANGQGPGATSGAAGGQRGAPPMGQYGILHVIGGNDRGKQCELSKVVINIGRGADQDLVLADIAVSRRHVKIHLQPNGYRLQDLGSGNGTLVNGKRVEEVLLVDGDQIELGNTLLRFEHPPSRSQSEAPPPAPPPAAVQPPYAPPAYGQPPMPAPPAPAPFMPAPQYPPPMAPPQPQAMSGAMAFGGAPAPVGGPPFGSAAAPAVAQPMQPQGMAPPYAPQASFLDSDSNRKLAFGGVLALLVIGLGGLVYQVRFSHPAQTGEANEAVAHYTAGTTNFKAYEYEAARKEFQAALEMAPDSPELKRYIEACDTETKAIGHIKDGKRALEQRRYGEALKAFQQVEEKSVQYDDAQKQAREARAAAATTSLTEAKNLSLTDAQAALGKINEGLQYDPDNPALLELRAKVNSGATIPALPNGKEAKAEPKEPKEPKEPTRVAVVRPPRKRNPPPEPRAVVKAPPPAPELPNPCDIKSNPAARGLYQGRAFDAAINATQNCAKVKGAPPAKTMEIVTKLGEMRGLLARAGQQEGSNPGAALSLYRNAESLDRQLSGGLLGSYLGGKTSALSQRAGSAPAPAPRPTPVASGDPKRDAEAEQYLQQARAVMQKDPSKAKLLCRKAMQLYGRDTSQPKFQQAFNLLRSIKSRDDDEE